MWPARIIIIFCKMQAKNAFQISKIVKSFRLFSKWRQKRSNLIKLIESARMFSEKSLYLLIVDQAPDKE